MLSDGSMSYTWDGANRLIRVEQGENTYQHAYNGLGQRLKLTVNGVENRFLYDGQSQWVFGAMNVSTQATTRFVLGPMGLLSQQTGSSPLLSPMLDGQGSVRAVISDAQAEIRRFSPHGSLLMQRGDENLTAYGFGGGYEDPSGLSYLFTSFYHPGIGQGVQQLGPIQQFWSNYNILANYAGNPNNPLGARLGISLLAGLYGAFALIPAALAIAMNPPLAVGTGLIAAGISGINYELARSGYGGPQLQQQAQNSSQMQAMIEGGYFGAIGGTALGMLGGAGWAGRLAVGALGMATSVPYTVQYAQDISQNGWNPYNSFNLGLGIAGISASALTLAQGGYGAYSSYMNQPGRVAIIMPKSSMPFSWSDVPLIRQIGAGTWEAAAYVSSPSTQAWLVPTIQVAMAPSAAVSSGVGMLSMAMAPLMLAASTVASITAIGLASLISLPPEPGSSNTNAWIDAFLSTRDLGGHRMGRLPTFDDIDALASSLGEAEIAYYIKDPIHAMINEANAEKDLNMSILSVGEYWYVDFNATLDRIVRGPGNLAPLSRYPGFRAHHAETGSIRAYWLDTLRIGAPRGSSGTLVALHSPCPRVCIIGPKVGKLLSAATLFGSGMFVCVKHGSFRRIIDSPQPQTLISGAA